MRRAIPVLFLALVAVASGCVQQGQLANPSAVYCEKQGYSYVIRDMAGGQEGYCVFGDGSECMAWEYYRGSCSPSGGSICVDMCGDGTCQKVVCLGEGCPCAETPQSCPVDCPAAGGYVDVTAEEANALLNTLPGLVIIDVSPHYAEGHLPGAVNHYVGDGSLDETIPALDKDKTYLVYCHADSASILGAQKLVDAGFTRVYRLEGNYAAWVAAGYGIEY